MSHDKTKIDSSYGVVPFSLLAGEWCVLLVQPRGSKYWGFPKGHSEAGESALESAARELKEETNLRITRVLSEAPFMEHYQFSHKGTHITKTVFFFAAVVDGDLRCQEEEISDARWVPLADAFHLLTYESGKSLLRTALKFLP